MGASLDQFFSILFWIIGALTVGFLIVFAFRLLTDARDTLVRVRKRLAQPRH